jgi:hypothetical protein
MRAWDGSDAFTIRPSGPSHSAAANPVATLSPSRRHRLPPLAGPSPPLPPDLPSPSTTCPRGAKGQGNDAQPMGRSADDPTAQYGAREARVHRAKRWRHRVPPSLALRSLRPSPPWAGRGAKEDWGRKVAKGQRGTANQCPRAGRSFFQPTPRHAESCRCRKKLTLAVGGLLPIQPPRPSDLGPRSTDAAAPAASRTPSGFVPVPDTQT